MNDVEIRLHDTAERELARQADWYEDRRPGLGVEFLDEVNKALDKVRRSPEEWPRSGRVYRWIPLRRFPYVIHYRILDPTHVWIAAVAHNRRRPGYWKWRRP